MPGNVVHQPSQAATDADHEAPPARHLRITPRNSDGDQAEPMKETPWRTLNQLASIPKPTTPLRRASSAGPSSTRRSARRTPGTAHRANGSGRKAIAVTPHGRAAQRELELRRAGFTPGKDRRRSGRQQRETPRDILRQLSRHLAPKTLPTVPTPEGQAILTKRSRFRIREEEDELEDGLEVERPRLSLPLDDEDDDDSLLLPPHSAGLEDENFTVQSVELGRRAISEQPPRRFSRGSFGSIRMSDVFADLNDTTRGGLGGVTYDSSYVTGDNIGGGDMVNPSDDEQFQVDNTATSRDFGLDRGIFSLTSGRDSDIRPANLPGDDTENTFLLAVPNREVSDELSPEYNEQFAFDQGKEAGLLADKEEQDREDDQISQDEESHVNALDLASSPKVLEGSISMQDATMRDLEISQNAKARSTRRRKLRVSKHGIQYPSLPDGVIKRLATTFARTAGSKAKINKEALDAIMQASDWFFEQVSDDLGAYSKHAGRKTIDESDITTLMARQRQTNAISTPFSLAQRYLPRELLQELRMVPPSKLKRGRLLERVEEAEGD